ncbi:50S ribosomal protein L22, chloroplastic [Capsicum annuum]|nr:50S ribosomal protein L22, chloroplastic [Capsicum annuum]
MSANKARRVIDQIRGCSYEEALMILELLLYRACYPILKLVYSAVANASYNTSSSETNLVISKAEVNGALARAQVNVQNVGKYARHPNPEEEDFRDEELLNLGNPRSAEQIATQLPRATGEIIPPPLAPGAKFNITSTMIQLLNLKGLFGGLPGDDPNLHLVTFVTICKSFNNPKVGQNAIQLRSGLYIPPGNWETATTSFGKISMEDMIEKLLKGFEATNSSVTTMKTDLTSISLLSILFIGLENMGSRMADSLIKVGYEVALHDIHALLKYLACAFPGIADHWLYILVLNEKDHKRIIGPYKRVLKLIDEIKNAMEPHFQEAGRVEMPFHLHRSKLHDSLINDPVQSPRPVFGPTNGLFHKISHVSTPPVPLCTPFEEEIDVGAHDMDYVEAQKNYGIEEENEVDAVNLDEDDENIGDAHERELNIARGGRDVGGPTQTRMDPATGQNANPGTYVSVKLVSEAGVEVVNVVVKRLMSLDGLTFRVSDFHEHQI